MAEYKFVKELPDDYQCMICAKVLNEPHLTDCCGQHFCQACLEQWFKKQSKKICPHCRSKSFTHMRYIPLKRKIDDLEVYCPNQDDGCKEITKLGVLDAHKGICGLAKVICTQGCGKSILRKDLIQHCSNECSKRKINCKFCGLVDHYEVINGKHTTTCKEYPVNCPRGCILGSGIKRKDIAEHAETCPLEMVPCSFIKAGCSTRVPRKDLNAHMESNTQQHLMKMMTAYSNLNIKHSKLKLEHSRLKLEHTKLKLEHLKFHKEHNKLSSQVANLTNEPVKMTESEDHSSFAFNITLSRGWTSPPFSVLDGYTFTIKHKEGRKASLMLMKGKYDDQLKWPMNLPYKLEICIEEPHRTTLKGRKTATTRHTVRTVQLSDNFARVTSVCSKEIADIDLRERELLNYEMVVRLVAVNLSPRAASYSYCCTPTCVL
jgi:TNF receptor-associated factor 4